MIYPHTVKMSWGGDIELEARELPAWAADQPLTWTVASGQGSILDLGGIKIRFTGPQAGPFVPTKTVIHLYAGDGLVGECTITFAIIAPSRERDPPEGFPKPPEPDPPPEEEEIIPTVDCGVDPEHPEEPLKIHPAEYMAGPLEEVHIGIVKIWEVCEEGCYTWKISSGGGTLLCNCGREAVYLTPRLNAECEANAVIDLIYCERVIASCYVTINTWGRAGLAYVIFETPDFGAGGDIWGRAQRYDCQDEPLQPLTWLHLWVTRAYSTFAGKYQWYVSENKYVGGVFDTLGDIPMAILQAAYPAHTVDARTRNMKRAGCCPMGLIGHEYFIEEKEEHEDANAPG